MKKIVITALIVGLSSALIINAQSRNAKRIAANEARYEKNGLYDKKATELNCQFYDDDEHYTATSMMRIQMGSNTMTEKDFTPQFNQLLEGCQQQLQMKFKGQYKAVIRDYFDQMDIDGQSSVASHIESAGERIINQAVNDYQEACREIGEMDEAGFAMIYMGIMMKKTVVMEQVAKELSQDKQAGVRFNEEKFREAAGLNNQ